jgi:hypothetical protein
LGIFEHWLCKSVHAGFCAKTDDTTFSVEKTLLDAMQKGGGLDSPFADAKTTICAYQNGFAIRFCEGPRGYLNWQAGLLRAEYRDYQGKGMETPFRAHVSLFQLLGYGYTQDEAVEKAMKNPHGGNHARRI